MKQLAELSARMRRPQAIADTHRDTRMLCRRTRGSGLQSAVSIQELTLVFLCSNQRVNACGTVMRGNGRRSFSTFTLKLYFLEYLI
jgi:hypothetical protein